MRPRDSGAIVNVGSALAFIGIPLQAPYCASKFAVPRVLRVVARRADRGGQQHQALDGAHAGGQYPAVRLVQDELPRAPEARAADLPTRARGRPHRQHRARRPREKVLGSWNRIVVAVACDRARRRQPFRGTHRRAVTAERPAGARRPAREPARNHGRRRRLRCPRDLRRLRRRRARPPVRPQRPQTFRQLGTAVRANLREQASTRRSELAVYSRRRRLRSRQA